MIFLSNTHGYMLNRETNCSGRLWRSRSKSSDASRVLSILKHTWCSINHTCNKNRGENWAWQRHTNGRGSTINSGPSVRRIATIWGDKIVLRTPGLEEPPGHWVLVLVLDKNSLSERKNSIFYTFVFYYLLMHQISVEKVIVYTLEVSYDENGYHHICNCCNGLDCFLKYKNKWVIFSLLLILWVFVFYLTYLHFSNIHVFNFLSLCSK